MYGPGGIPKPVLLQQMYPHRSQVTGRKSNSVQPQYLLLLCNLLLLIPQTRVLSFLPLPLLQVACGGYHTLAVCAHDAMQQEAAEKQSGYKKKMMHFFSKPVTVDVPDSRQHSTGPNTSGSGAVTPLDRVSEGSLSLMAHGSNGRGYTLNLEL